MHLKSKNRITSLKRLGNWGGQKPPDKDRIAAIPVTVSKDDQDRKDFENLEEIGREPGTYSCGEDQQKACQSFPL
jgi:hypothetical protein